VTIVAYLKMSIPSYTAKALKNSLDTNQQWYEVVRSTAIEVVQGERYLRNLTMVTSVQNPHQTDMVEIAGESPRLLQKASTANGAPVYVILTVVAEMLEGRGNTVAEMLDSAFQEVKEDFIENLNPNPDGGPNLFTSTLQKLASEVSPSMPLTQATIEADVHTNPINWGDVLMRDGEGYVDSFAPTETPTQEPTTLPTPMPTVLPTIKPTSTQNDHINAAADHVNSTFSSPAALGGLAAGVILLVGLLAYAGFRYITRDKDAETKLMEGNAYSDQDFNGGHPEYFEDSEEYVERPSGGVEMLENPVHRRASQPFNNNRGGQRGDAMDDDNASHLDYDQEYGAQEGQQVMGGVSPPQRSPADPYQRFGLAPPGPGAPQQRLSMSVRGAMTTEITGPGGAAPQAREPMKRFSVAPTLAEFTQTNVAARLGVPRPEFGASVGTAGPVPQAPRHLRPFQPHSPTAPMQPTPPQLSTLPLQSIPTSITIAPAKRLNAKLGEGDEGRGTEEG